MLICGTPHTYAGAAEGREIGVKRTVLPATHVGSPRYMREKYRDACAMCRVLGKPDLFITFTCNPRWREIQEALAPGQQPNDRPDIIARVFKLKLKELMMRLVLALR